MKPLQIAYQDASGKSVTQNGSLLRNWYVQSVPAGSKQPVILVGTPGTTILSTLPTIPPLAGKVMGDLLYVVTNSGFYSVDQYGAVITIGAVSITGRATMATNGTYMVFCGGNGNGYYYSVAGGLVQFSGAAWLNYTFVRFLDGYFIFSAVDGSDVYGISGLNDITLDATEISYAESLPDEILAEEVLNGEIWLFGSDTTEVHYNSADVDFPFEKRQGVLIERGIGAAHTLVKEKTLYWLGDDRVFYMATGYTEARISDHAFEESIAIGEISDAHAYIYTEEGHKFLVVTFPTLELTWAFDIATGLWAKRSHYVWGERHHGNCFMRAFNQNIIGDFQNGNLYVMSLAAPTDSGDPIVRDMICPTIHAQRERVTMKAFEVKMKTGTAAPGEDPQAQLCWSDDGQNTWSNWHNTSFGKRGEYLTRVRWDRLGQFRERHMWLRIAEPIANIVIDGVFGDFS
jgi:hypothetical protein